MAKVKMLMDDDGNAGSDRRGISWCLKALLGYHIRVSDNRGKDKSSTVDK